MAGDASSVVRHHFADRPATSAGGVGSTSEVDGDRPVASGRVPRSGCGTLARMLVAFSVAPSGGGTDSVGDVVAEAVRVVRESGLPNETTSMFTTIEAPTWDEAMEVVKRAVEAVAARAPRVSLVLKADIRPGWTGQLQAKVERVEQALGGTTADDG
jgi:uncharacterized protein (TIGR00106 family)